MAGENIGATERLSALNKMVEGFIGNPSPTARAELSAGIKDHFAKLATETAERNAASAARIASLKASLPPLPQPKALMGMKPSTAILGAVAVGGGVYLASKLFGSKPKPTYWQDRIAQEAAMRGHDGRSI